MYISGHLSLPSQSFGFVMMKNCTTTIVYMSMLNCICKFDYNMPIFLLVLFILLFLSNSQNYNESHLFKYIFYLILVSILIDILWLALFFKSYIQIYTELELQQQHINNLQMKAWNYQHGIHILSIILSFLIGVIKFPLLYQCSQTKGMKN